MSEAMRTNRFDLLRLVFASTVFVGHALILPDLTGTGQAEFLLASLSELSIEGFFIISGGLVYGSYLRSKALGDYTGKRVRRLYPAYAVVILTAVVLALIFSPAAREDLPESRLELLTYEDLLAGQKLHSSRPPKPRELPVKVSLRHK